METKTINTEKIPAQTVKQLVRKKLNWTLSQAARKFYWLDRSEQLKMISPHVDKFYKPITAFLFFPEMCLVVKYEHHHGAEMLPGDITTLCPDEGLHRLKMTAGPKYVWHHLDPPKKCNTKNLLINPN